MMTFQIRASPCRPRDQRDVTALEPCDLLFQKFAGKFRDISAWPSGRSTFQAVSVFYQIFFARAAPDTPIPAHKGGSGT